MSWPIITKRHVFIIISYLYTITSSYLFEQAREILVQIAYAFSCFKNINRQALGLARCLDFDMCPYLHPYFA